MRRDEEFEQYARARQQRLFRQAYLLCGDRDSAQDLVQATLLKLYRAWPSVRRAEQVDAYGYKTMVRTYLDGERRRRRELDWHRRRDAARPAPSVDLRMTLLAALAELPARARAVVVLRYWEDLSIEQTADALGCSPGTVKSHASRALALLRDRLGEDYQALSAN
ncbi:RNA polymerase, sigma-24 subunit, ECF subfamily [Kribbella flavida DSM 17836]|uniref:RNA polymerase, sigma-24 subunit, ECF subfamily n=1 Tax=Kribbella flavida (strain DSM 17836 / JCM 10339 / NBRC 14399) TaxID=479435 RepID=D2PKJ2_KRIFD|nr:SigE family RNA polymerase sigma factor [Kribbella flavida]ADB30504.1 RNA polymerase, sigma-24 subunit, ECF subfamily [Kribbella flavida DSM 17836]